MGYRRSPDRVAAARNWRHFVERNAAVVAATGLPPLATASITEWDDFLMHGYVSGDRGAFDVDQLSQTQYASLVQLTENYFAAGYEFYTPMALRVEDQLALYARFGDGR